MSSSGFDDLPIEENPKRLQHRMEWEVRRARKLSDSIGEKAFTPIVFPDTDGLWHAAMVVAGRMAHLPDAVEATREVLEALAIPTVMADGGDGRIAKIQRGRVRFGDDGDDRYPIEEIDAGPEPPTPRPRRRAYDD